MTEQSGLQVRDLLPNSMEMESTLKEVLCKDPGIASTRLAWGFIGSQATGAVKSVLNLDVFAVLARAWCVAKELQEYTDSSKHPSGERSVVYLGEHTFTKTVYPILKITIRPYTSVSLRFALELAADIRAVALGICNGYITSVGSGDGNVGAQLKYNAVALNKLESRKVSFTAPIAFKAPGLAIASSTGRS